MNKFKKIKLAAGFGLMSAFAAMNVQAANLSPEPTAKVAASLTVAADQHAAYIAVAEATENMLTALNKADAKTRKDDAFIKDVFETHVEPLVNYRFITAMILGNSHLKNTSKEQFNELSDLLKAEFAASFTSALSYLSDNKVTIEPLKPDADSKVAKVKLTITQKGGPDVSVDFSLRRSSKDAADDPQSWKIYDVVAEGISMMSSYQSQYKSILNKGGVDGLIEALKKRQGQSAAVQIAPSPKLVA